MAKGISLHLGLNSVDPAHYAGWSGDLNACEADAEAMAEIATSLGYAQKTMLTAAATRPAVMSAIRSAAEALAPGDIFLLTYSGHGGQLPDKNGDEDDGLDETWCLFDGELVDDELYGLFTRFKAGVRVFMLSDSCHSGTVSKDKLAELQKQMESLAQYDPITGAPIPLKFRGMPFDVMRETYKANKVEYDKILDDADPDAKGKVNATVRLISGCMDGQLSSDGPFNGLFTQRLLRVWRRGSFEGNYQQFCDAIVAKMPSIQTPQHTVYGGASPEFDAQKPFTI